MTAPLGDAELRERLAPFVIRRWPVERLVLFVRSHEAGLPCTVIAETFGLEAQSARRLRLRLIAGGLIAARTGHAADCPWPSRDAELLAHAAGPDRSNVTIGAAMGLHPNKIAGRIHRLTLLGVAVPNRRHRPVPENLPHRPPDPFGVSPQWPLDVVTTLREEWPRKSVHDIAVLLGREDRAVRSKGGQLGLGPRRRPRHAEPKARRANPPPPPKCGRIVECCWPLGEPGTRDFRFCDVPSESGRSYCADHVAIAYGHARGRPDPMAGVGAILAGAP